MRPDAAAGTDLVVSDCEVTLLRGGAVVKTLRLGSAVGVEGTPLGCGGVIADGVRLRPTGAHGRVGGVPRVGLAEVEARARIPED